MKYFTETEHNIDGYLKNLKNLKDILDQKTYSFMLEHSFHDSEVHKIAVLNKKEVGKSQKSPVSVLVELTHPNNKSYALLWENVSSYSTDFDNSRNRMADSNQILSERGLDQWSHDELIQTETGDLEHEIMLFSKTSIKIKCKYFSLVDLS